MSKEATNLQKQIHKLQEQLAEKDAKINFLEETIANKNQIICNFHRCIYGQSSEKSSYILDVDLNQLSFFAP